MEAFIIIVGIIFSLFSSLVLSYISIATMVGPWIAPTLVLIGHIIFSMRRSRAGYSSDKVLASLQAIGAGGGIIATGIGFILPLLHFLDPGAFAQWIASPWYFCSMLTSLCLAAGGLGLVFGQWWSDSFMSNKDFPFPVSQLTYQVITSQNQKSQSNQLLGSIFGTTLLCAFRDGIGQFASIIPRTTYLFSSGLGRHLPFTIFPTLWAIGFSVGLGITIPLMIGLAAKYIVIQPLINHGKYLPWTLFTIESEMTLTIAFCSGMILFETLSGIYKTLTSKIALWKKGGNSWSLKRSLSGFSLASLTIKNLILPSLSLLSVVAVLSHFSFSPLSQFFLITFTLIATYQICQFGGKIGMIPFGRFSTFILIPLLLVFKLNAVQATIVCVFFDICAGAASDLLFDYKIGDMAGISRQKMYVYQWIGLVATAFGVGVFFYLLFTNFQLGSEAFFAQRAKAKALLIQSLNFDKYIVALGMLFGLLLKKLRVNASMVFGGLIMPNAISLGLAAGSLGTLFTKDTNKHLAIPAGILAAESLWIIVSIVTKSLF